LHKGKVLADSCSMSRRVGTEARGTGGRRGRSLNSLAVLLSSVALSFVLIALLVVTASHSAFSATTDNKLDSVTTAALKLTDDDSGTAMFNNVTGLTPGPPLYRCITVTYTGDVDPLPVKLYAAGAPAGDLTPYLTLTVEVDANSGGGFASCSGFNPTGTLYSGALGSVPGTYGTGLTAWDPNATGESRTFRFGLSVQDDTNAQGKSSTFGFTWETRSS
jgi:hypothetical protein